MIKDMIDVRYEYRKKRENLYLWLIRNMMPNRLILWCFIVVCGEDGDCPDPMYSRCYNYWTKKKNITDM